MDIEQLRRELDRPAEASKRLANWGIRDPDRAHANLQAMAAEGFTLDLMAIICEQLDEHLPVSSDPDMALNNLERFVRASRSPLSLGGLFERDPEALGILVQIFSTSQHLSELLIADNTTYDLLRVTEGQPVGRDVLVAEVLAEIDALEDRRAVMETLRRYKQRETLRISYGDIIRGQRLPVVTAQISHLADALVEGAIAYARRSLIETRGRPMRPDGRPARFVALGMGKLGGNELNYSSDIDLILLYDADGMTEGPRRIENKEFFDRLARDVVRLLAERTELGAAYRVDLRLRPEGEHGPLVPSVDSALQYYDVMGRTWERQAYVKARPVAGDLDLGHEFLERLTPWIYRRYLGLADITGIKALKRRIEQRATAQGHDACDVKTGHGGIRDIEFVIQFLQLLNGGDQPQLRTTNTLDAISQLAAVGCLTQHERSLLEEHYAFLRKVEHRLQIMFDLQTHLLPDDEDELRRLAIRMGYPDKPAGAARKTFLADYQSKTTLNRKILDHLLHDAFSDDAKTEPVVDLVLDPDPAPERIADVLGRYPFRDVPGAYQNLMQLAHERIRFLSTRRCRHFLASIAPKLLEAIAATSDPDSTLANLEKVSDSLGGKGELWGLFSFNEPSMRLYAELCSSSEFLSDILISNPGMIDELMDALVMNRLPTVETLRATLDELARGAEDLDPILHSFKSTQELHVGVRNILGKEDIETTFGALTNIAEVCLDRIAKTEFERLQAKLGRPSHGSGPRSGEDCAWVVLGMGKFGGREINYHSDLDIVFLYEDDGPTAAPARGRKHEVTTNQHFFSELGQRIIMQANRLGPYGRLYEVDPRLRPTGRSGALAVSFGEFARYFAEGQGQLWERQAMTKARPVLGTPGALREAQQLAMSAAYSQPWMPADAEGIRRMRARLEETAGPSNLKRGRGGMVDVEFIAQLLQLKHGRDDPNVRAPGTSEALDRLHRAGYLAKGDHEFLVGSYRFLRALECRLRLLHSTARDDLPESELALAKLAQGMQLRDAASLMKAFHHYRDETRKRFDTIVEAASR